MKKLIVGSFLLMSSVFMTVQAQTPQTTTETKKTTKTEHKKTTKTDNGAPAIEVNVTKRKPANTSVHKRASTKQSKTTTTTTTTP